LLRATARYWSRFATARYVEPLEVVRDSDEAVVATAVQQQHAFELSRQVIDAG
jgi:hypothetical protein